MFEAVGKLVVGVIATGLLIALLQLGYETILSFVGYRRFWLAKHRYQRRLRKPFPAWKVAKAAVMWQLDLSGDYILGALRVPADPRRPIRREPFYGA